MFSIKIHNKGLGLIDNYDGICFDGYDLSFEGDVNYTFTTEGIKALPFYGALYNGKTYSELLKCNNKFFLSVMGYKFYTECDGFPGSAATMIDNKVSIALSYAFFQRNKDDLYYTINNVPDVGIYNVYISNELQTALVPGTFAGLTAMGVVDTISGKLKGILDLNPNEVIEKGYELIKDPTKVYDILTDVETISFDDDRINEWIKEE